MGPFWKSLGEDLKDRGRDATLFIVAMAALLGLIILIAIINETGLTQYIIPALPWMGVVAAMWAGMTTIRRARARRREHLQHPPLSCDELRVARSKLVKDRNRNGA